jgi:hypothetical protein
MNRSNDPLTAWVLEDPAARGPLALAVLGGLLVLPLIVFGVYLFRMGTHAMAARQFPPAGYRMLRAVESITGDAAVRQAKIARAMAMLLIAGAIAIAAFLWRFGVVISNRL